MKNWKALFLIISIITNISFASSLQRINKIAAIVNNNVILESDINNLSHFMKLNRNQANQQYHFDKDLRHYILDLLITDQLILQISEEIGIEVTDTQLDNIITDIARKNNMSIDQMLNVLAHYNINYSTYRNQIRKEILISEVQNLKIKNKITIFPQEVELLAKQLSNQTNNKIELNISYILVPLPTNATYDQIIEAENNANVIIKQIQNNIDLNKLIQTDSFSQKILKKSRTSWSNIWELPPIFSEKLSTIKKGSIIGPIRSEVGFHILRINDWREKDHNTFFTEIHIRHILLMPSSSKNEHQVQEKLEKIAIDIKNGKISFSDAAEIFSQDPSSACYGGDLGWVTADIYGPTFQRAVMQLKKGQISSPIRSSVGFHLIEMLDIRNIDEVDKMQKDRAYRILFNRKFSEEAMVWIQEQRADAYIKILSDF